jgi:hypothetical protein
VCRAGSKIPSALCWIAWLNIHWLNPIAEESELPDHLRSAGSHRPFAHRWAPFLITDPAVQNYPDQPTKPMGNCDDGLRRSQARHQAAMHVFEDACFDLGRKSPPLTARGPYLAGSSGNPKTCDKNNVCGFTWLPNTNIFPGVATCVTGQPAECGGSVFDLFGVSQNFRSPYFFNYNLNVEKSLGNGMAVWQVGYVGSQGRKLAIMLNINQLPGGATVVNPVTGQATTNGKFVSQFPNYGSMNQLNSIGNSNYNALQSTLRLRAWHGLSSQFA